MVVDGMVVTGGTAVVDTGTVVVGAGAVVRAGATGDGTDGKSRVECRAGAAMVAGDATTGTTAVILPSVDVRMGEGGE